MFCLPTNEWRALRVVDFLFSPLPNRYWFLWFYDQKVTPKTLELTEERSFLGHVLSHWTFLFYSKSDKKPFFCSMEPNFWQLWIRNLNFRHQPFFLYFIISDLIRDWKIFRYLPKVKFLLFHRSRNVNKHFGGSLHGY